MKESELIKMTVKQLRELAKEDTKISGVTAMKKEQLVEALVTERDVEVVRTKKIRKMDLSPDQAKAEILRLKQKKEELEKSKNMNKKQLKNIIRRVRNLKRLLRNVS
ncbi:Rho termination factor N-terminal domain-containing protein [candidate division KSB1 bacterium]